MDKKSKLKKLKNVLDKQQELRKLVCEVTSETSYSPFVRQEMEEVLDGIDQVGPSIAQAIASCMDSIQKEDW